MIFDLEAKNILEKLSIENCPVGMGGCKSQGHSYDCCEYDITIFDGKRFFPETWVPIRKRLLRRIKLALCEPVPLAVAMFMVKSFTILSIDG